MTTSHLQISTTRQRDATNIVQTLQSYLIRNGVPASTISISRQSDEYMDTGSLLNLDWKGIVDILTSAGSIAALGNALYDLMGRKPGKIDIRIDAKIVTITSDMAEHEIVERIKQLI